MIDDDELKKKLMESPLDALRYGIAETVVNKALTTDIVKRGKWEKTCESIDDEHICSLCKEDSLYTPGEYEVLSNYCPHCGAKMDLE